MLLEIGIPGNWQEKQEKVPQSKMAKKMGSVPIDAGLMDSNDSSSERY
jgi:hypothetical protein